MILRNSYFVGIMACALAAVSASSFVEPAQAETLKITGPNGEVNSIVARQYGPTTSADTFWSIAQKVRPNNNISIYQVMAALFDANPHAFSSDNYNSLERGMTLLVPSADVMGQISKADAKLRAENNDKRLPNANKASQQTVLAPVVQPKVISPQKPLQIIAEAPQETTKASQPVIDELTVKLENEQNKTLSLTDELARSEDMLMIKDADNLALKSKIQELTLQLSTLQEDFQLLSEKYLALETAHELLVEETSKPEVIEEPTDFWRSLSDNMVLLAIIAALPLILIFLFIFWLMRRRNNQTEQESAVPISGTAPVEQLADPDDLDDIENLAIHLDDEDSSESIDDLLDLDLSNSDELTLDATDDTDMYIVEEEQNAEEAEGTSLDDLWAEAMEEQDELEPLESEENFDNLLDGLDSLPADTTEEKPEEDLDSLLAEFDMPEEEPVTPSFEPESTTSDAQDDIDSLLADFDLPAEDLAVEEPVIDEAIIEESIIDEAITAASEPESTTSDAQDDIDSLLADFDLPAEDPAVEEAVIDEAIIDEAKTAVSEPELTTSDSQDDIDSLLASIDVEDVELPHDFTAEIAAELEDDVAVTLDETDNIEELIAEVDTDKEFAPLAPEEVDVEQVLASELEEIESELEIDTDNTDLDSLISDLEAEVPETREESFEGADDFAAQIAAELEQDVEQETLETDLDSLLADLDTSTEAVSNDGHQDLSKSELTFATGDDATLNIEDDNLDNSLVSELLAAEQSVGSDSTKETDSDVDDLDALLADFDIDKIADDDEPSLFSTDDDNVSEADFDTMLAGLSAIDANESTVETTVESTVKSSDASMEKEASDSLQENVTTQEKESGFFEDLKSTKADTASLDWESELFKQASNQGDIKQDDIESNNDEGYSLNEDDLIENSLTVDEALAALDAKENQPSKPSDDSLSAFEKNNDYIDIDILLNDADEVVDVSDQYKDVEVDVGEVNSLIGNAEMIDVDDEENSVNAKLDLARAYIEIEDEDSAKALLAEVNIDGNERQQVEATKLLDDMS